MTPETSLIIITLDRPARLREALVSLEEQTRALDEIVVVDNGPSAETAQAVAEFSARLPVRRSEEPRRGFGPARNRGIAEARGEVILFLDDDCLAGRDWVERLLAPIESGEAEIVGGSRVCITPGLPAHLDWLSTDAPVLHPRLPRGPAPHLSTANLAMRREVAEKTGRFDEHLANCEDRDFCLRARGLGFRILYQPSACIRHQPPVYTLGDYLRRMVRYGKGTSEYFLQRGRVERLARLLPASPALRLVLLPVLAVAGTLYLIWRNWPRQPEALWLSPLLFLGQLYWHWGGYQAARAEASRC